MFRHRNVIQRQFSRAKEYKCNRLIWVLISLTTIICLRLLSLCVRQHNKTNILPSTQLQSVMSSIWQHVSTSQGYLQASSIKYIKGIPFMLKRIAHPIIMICLSEYSVIASSSPCTENLPLPTVSSLTILSITPNTDRLPYDFCQIDSAPTN